MATRILVVDDEASVRHLLQVVLATEGYEPLLAANGAEGVKQFRYKPADLVITDMVMPGRDGIETVIALRKEYRDVPIIAMSGLSSHSPTYLQLAQRLGARRTLSKPFPVSELLRAVDEVIAEGPPAEPDNKSSNS